MVYQSAIVVEARSWIGTSFHHQGRVKKNATSKGGCDCIGLIIGVTSALGIKCKGYSLAQLDNKNYSKHPDGVSLKAALDEYLTPIPVNSIQPGDVLLIRFNKEPQHVAFVGDYGGGLSLIHCYIQARGVVEHVLDDYWMERVVGAYSL